MSKRVKCSIFSLLLIVGSTLVLYQPFISYFVAPKAMKGVQSIYDDLSYLQLESNLEQLKEREQDLFDFSDVKSIDASETLPSNLILDKKHVIGMVYVPSIDFKMPILYGATHQNMLVGGGTLKANQVMGKGNYAIAGHNHPNQNLLFAPIRKINEGDLMYTTDKKYVYVYQAVYKEVIMPDRTEVIEDKEGKNELSLLSCYSSDGSDRIVVQGDLIEKKMIDEVDENLRNELFNM